MWLRRHRGLQVCVIVTAVWFLALSAEAQDYAWPAAFGAAQAKAGAKAGPARIVVLVPQDAKVYFDGEPTKQQGKDRLFLTPPLAAGKDRFYELKAEFTANGKSVSQTRTVAVQAGKTTLVDFNEQPSKK